MSRWILKSMASEDDPVSFERLALLLADGKIEETDLVRPDQADAWQAVDSVIGLCHAAEILRSSRAATADRSEDGQVVSTNERFTVTPSEPNLPGPNCEPAVTAKHFSWWRILLSCLAISFVNWCAWSWCDDRIVSQRDDSCRGLQTKELCHNMHRKMASWTSSQVPAYKSRLRLVLRFALLQ